MSSKAWPANGTAVKSPSPSRIPHNCVEPDRSISTCRNKQQTASHDRSFRRGCLVLGSSSEAKCFKTFSTARPSTSCKLLKTERGHLSSGGRGVTLGGHPPPPALNGPTLWPDWRRHLMGSASQSKPKRRRASPTGEVQPALYAGCCSQS